MRARRIFLPLFCAALMLGAGCRTVRSFPVAITDLPIADPPPKTPVNPCIQWESYRPDPAHPEYTPARTLRMNVHFMDSRDSAHNFRQAAGRQFARELIAIANARLDTNEQNWRSPSGTPVLPKGYRYRLAPQPLPGDDGIYFHYDDDLWYYVSQGRNQNNYSRTVVDKYAVGLDSIINVFLLVHPEDSVRSSTYRANGQGIALGTALKMAGVYEMKQTPQSTVGLFNHEVGHILSLSHAWTGDGCPDTDPHPNRCWDWTPTPPCDTLATNNMMDYNANQSALTPCQIAKIHALLANANSPIRRCLDTDYCRPQPGRDVMIRDSVSWDGARDLTGDLTIAPGGVLMLSCRLSMPAGSRITVQPGGRLWLNGARLHNACGLPWKGIYAQRRRGMPAGQVLMSQKSEMENTGLR